MPQSNRPVVILMADDDEDDRRLAQDALRKSHLSNEVRTVGDGEELLEYLRRQGRYAEGLDAQGLDAPRPGLILLDLNMPRMDGREALAEIKADPALRSIPVVVLTTSQADEDICRAYEIGANSFISKPVTFEGLVSVMSAIGQYWFQIVELPKAEVESNHREG